jgi:flagellar basal body P-ring formation protein FlgA
VRTKLLPFIALSALAPAAAMAFEPAAGQVHIELRPQVAARGEQVLLGDVAILRTRDLATIQRLAALPLGRAPRAGSEAVLGRDDIARWIRSQLGITRSQVEWTGPYQSTVRGVAQDLAAVRVEKAATAALREWLTQHASRYTMDALALPGDLQIPAGTVQLAPRPLAAGAEPQSRMTVWVDVFVDGRFARAVPVGFAVAAYREAWVAPRPMSAGVALKSSGVEWREVQVAGRTEPGDGSSIVSTELPKGWQTTRALKEGEPLTPRNAAPTPAISRGEWVALHMKSGPVELESRVQALQDGQVGQIVQVRGTKGSAPVTARVVGAGRVEALL